MSAHSIVGPTGCQGVIQDKTK